MLTFRIYLSDGGTNFLGNLGLANVVEHHGSRKNLRRGVADILTRNVGRATMNGLEHSVVVADIRTRSNTQATYQAGAQVTRNVAIQVREHDDVELAGIGNQVHAKRVDDAVVERNASFVIGRDLAGFF